MKIINNTHLGRRWHSCKFSVKEHTPWEVYLTANANEKKKKKIIMLKNKRYMVKGELLLQM